MNQQLSTQQVRLGQIKEALLNKTIVEQVAEMSGVTFEKAKTTQLGVYMEVAKSVGGKGDLTGCTNESLVQVCLDSARMGLTLDGRQYAHIVAYKGKATLQIGYRGYIAKLKEYYRDADITVRPIYDGDEFFVTTVEGNPTYSHTPKDPFRTGSEGLQGVVVAVEYTDGGRLIRKIEPVPRERIDRAQDTARQDYIWKSDYLEKAKVAAIKNALKVMFAGLQGMQDAVSYDNMVSHDIQEHQKEMERLKTQNAGATLAAIANDNFNQDEYDEQNNKEQRDQRQLPDGRTEDGARGPDRCGDQTSPGGHEGSPDVHAKGEGTPENSIDGHENG